MNDTITISIEEFKALLNCKNLLVSMIEMDISSNYHDTMGKYVYEYEKMQPTPVAAFPKIKELAKSCEL